ncbi:hypothetical protein NM688_g3622 [Phlebia brevispora]|uniref:Uncharacterized protein n=1 Tax=Phlebia brevispora TaxID=194682 RepID=A0ACC1T5L9_9APHY|nr:hypothetical protein NM688_g3622 [Phlebia brevispora]
MTSTKATPLLPVQHSDLRTHGRSGIRFYLSSRRVRYAIALAALFVISLFVLVNRGPNLPLPAAGDELSSIPEPIELPGPAEPPSGDPTSRARAGQVKEAFIRGYSAYYNIAFPHDELLPKSNSHADKLGGWGASTVDSLDTMLLMGLDDLYRQATPHVAHLTFDEDKRVQFFETVIRYLGGLLSVYAMTKDPLFLARADDLGRQLLPAFNTTHGLPASFVNVNSGLTSMGWMGNVAILSEMASCQMEYRYLAHLTGRPEYVRVVDHVLDHMMQYAENGGLYATTFDLTTGRPFSNAYSVGAMADSAYEYFLKEWLLTGRTEQRFLDMYLQSAEAIINHLLYVSPNRKLLFVADANRHTLLPDNNLQHLSCFIAGLFALGAATIPNVDPRHAWAAEGLGQTCWLTYADTVTGLGPERVRFPNARTKWVDEIAAWEAAGRPDGTPPGVNERLPVTQGEDKDYATSDPRYLLRPEVRLLVLGPKHNSDRVSAKTLESMYILWRTTGDTKWRERGWAMFEAIDNHTRTEDAYASVLDVNRVPTPKDNDLPSFFFAETLKYAYLLALDEDIVPLDKWVFNTEAHPLPIYTWSEWERSHLNITFPNATLAPSPERTSVNDKVNENPQPPDIQQEQGTKKYWDTKDLKLLPMRFVVAVLCAIAVGRTTLDGVWKACKSEEYFLEGRKELSDRISTVTFVAGLLLSTEAAFITTTAPLVMVINYNLRGPYILLLLSFGVTLGGLIVGSAVAYVLTKADKSWFEETFMSSKLRVCCWLILVGYPFLSIGVSTSCLAFGLLVAAWNAHDRLVKYGAFSLLLVPASMIPVFAITQYPLLRKKLSSYKPVSVEDLEAGDGVRVVDRCD